MSSVQSDETPSEIQSGQENEPLEPELVSELEAGPRAERPNFLTATRFTDFDLPPEILEGLDNAGFEYCTPIQAQAIPVALKGDDIAGQAQTGTGKTTAFLVPLLNRLLKNKALEPGLPRAIIVTPTRELALQIHEDALILAGGTSLRQVLVIGGLDYKEQAELLSSGPEIVICTPGRIIDYLQQGVFKTRAIEAAVVDEADRLLDMGFIKDLKYLLGKLPPFTQRQTMLFSATLDERVLELTYQYMNPPQYITAEPDKATKISIEQELYHVGRDEKLPLLMGLLRREEHRRVIIFVNTKSGVEWLAKKLAMNGFQAEGITGDLPQPRRLKLMEAFKENRLQILVATDVASRGIHVDDVSHVYNYDLPQDAENYVHRIGRTARAGHSGKAVSFGCEDYVFHLEAIENFLGEKIPVFWAEQDWLQEDLGGEVRLKERRVGGDKRRTEKRGGRETGGGGRVGRGPAKSQRPGGIFGLAPRLSSPGSEDPRQILNWSPAVDEAPPVEAELMEVQAGDGPEGPEREGREGRRRKRRRGRRGGREAAVSAAPELPDLSGEAAVPEASAASPASAEAEPPEASEDSSPEEAPQAPARKAPARKPRSSSKSRVPARALETEAPAGVAVASEARPEKEAPPAEKAGPAEKSGTAPARKAAPRKKAASRAAEAPAEIPAGKSAGTKAKSPVKKAGAESAAKAGRSAAKKSSAAGSPAGAEAEKAAAPKTRRPAKKAAAPAAEKKAPAEPGAEAASPKSPAKKTAAKKETEEKPAKAAARPAAKSPAAKKTVAGKKAGPAEPEAKPGE